MINKLHRLQTMAGAILRGGRRGGWQGGGWQRRACRGGERAAQQSCASLINKLSRLQTRAREILRGGWKGEGRGVGK